MKPITKSIIFILLAIIVGSIVLISMSKYYEHKHQKLIDFCNAQGFNWDGRIERNIVICEKESFVYGIQQETFTVEEFNTWRQQQ